MNIFDNLLVCELNLTSLSLLTNQPPFFLTQLQRMMLGKRSVRKKMWLIVTGARRC